MSWSAERHQEVVWLDLDVDEHIGVMMQLMPQQLHQTVSNNAVVCGQGAALMQMRALMHVCNFWWYSLDGDVTTCMPPIILTYHTPLLLLCDVAW